MLIFWQNWEKLILPKFQFYVFIFKINKIVILFVKNIAKFFIEGGDKSAIILALILFNLIILLGFIVYILNKKNKKI